MDITYGTYYQMGRDDAGLRPFFAISRATFANQLASMYIIGVGG